ncbi:J domain-containing protein [Geminicoccus roseus]|uniref:J domain-containing protein n=1 Tax=Geminicoccus roseus TaxID=404900 RepID=UPI0004286F8F|nr:J domain-containing protein [Geminicoccus roseus]
MIAEEPLRQSTGGQNHARGGAHRGGPVRTCAWPGCDACGEYRAPLSRASLRDYQWLCLEHVREFNRRWDYFQGMDADEIEAQRRDDVTWSRPTWPPGLNTADMRLKDPFELLHAHGFTSRSRREAPASRPPTTAQTHAQTLGLSLGFSVEELKRRYKTLAKQHHPDLHGGDRHQEERLKQINAAYTWLLAHPDAR